MSLIPRWYNRIPSLFGKRSALELEDEFAALASYPTGLTVSSDDKHVFIEAAVPGLTAKEVEVSIDADNCLWIKGNKKEEVKNKAKHFYRKATTNFSYCVPLWEEIDSSEPQATCKNGVMRITFAKKEGSKVEAKKISVKEEK